MKLCIPAIITVLMTLHPACRPARDCNAIKSYAGEGPVPLHIAAQEGNLAELLRLKKEKADINLANRWGWTALFFSVINGHYETAEFLLDNGACVNVKSGKGGHTPLHYAASNGDNRIITLLLKEGADINMRDAYDNTPLHLAVTGNHTGAAKILINRKALINTKNNRGSTPLHIAVWEQNIDLVEFLIQKGADVSLTDMGNKTSSDLAQMRGNDKIIALFPRKK